MLVAYTAQKLKFKPRHDSPVIHMYSNGSIYLYRSLLKKLGVIVPGTCILFSYNPIEECWYISLDKNGLPIYSNDRTTHNLKYYITSTSLREKIILTHSNLFNQIESRDSFYMKCAEHPTHFKEHGKQEFFKIEIIK